MNTKELIIQANDLEVKKTCSECSQHCTCGGEEISVNYSDMCLNIIETLIQAKNVYRENKFISDRAKDRFTRTISELGSDSSGVQQGAKLLYESFYLDTFEDLMAEVFIRFFILCGHNKIYELPIKEVYKRYSDSSVSDIINICRVIHVVEESIRNKFIEEIIVERFSYLYAELLTFCKSYEINIEDQIYARLLYKKILINSKVKE